MQLDKNDVIRIRAAALQSFKDSGLRERALAGSKHHDDFIYCEKEFINLFSDAMDGLNTQTSITGIELIAQERQEQIGKHGRTIQSDVETNDNGQLVDASLQLLAVEYNEGWDSYDTPDGWDKEIMTKMINKPLKERFVIAGALIAAEIDRLQATEGKQEGGGQ